MDRQTKAVLTLKAQHSSTRRFYQVSTTWYMKDKLKANFALCFPPVVKFWKCIFLVRKEKLGTIWAKYIKNTISFLMYGS